MSKAMRTLFAAVAVAAILALPAGVATAVEVTWDTVPGTVGVGDGAITGGAGTWDLVTANWTTDGGLNNVAWDNTANATDTAVFTGTAGTVTVDGTINLGGLTFNSSASWTISGGTLAFAPGSVISNSDNRYWQTITSTVTGSPNVETKDFGAGGSYMGIRFAPESGTVTLGNVLNPNNTGNTDKAGFSMAGSTTGNSVASISYAGGDKYGTVYKEGTSTWTVGNVNTGTIQVNGGNLIAAGQITTQYGHLQLNGGTFHYNDPNSYVSGNIKFQGGSLDNTSGAAITAKNNVAQTWNGSTVTFIGSNGADSDLNLGTGAVSLTNNTTVTVVNAATTLTIGGVISDGANTYGITKAGDGTLVLTGNSTYKGNTTVSAGTLSLAQAYLSDTANLYVSSTSTLNLTYGSTDTVFALFVDGALQPAGTYDSSTSAWLTGSGSIYNSGGLLPADTYKWDGALIGGDGDGFSNGGAGTWSTSNDNWDVGIAARQSWSNFTGGTAKAVFGGTGGTVTLAEAITVKDIVFEGSSSYTLAGQTINFAPGGSISVTYPQAKHTITSAITGSPDVNIATNTSYEGLTFAPTSGTVTLGTCNVPSADGTSDKAGIHLAGTTTGNSVGKVTFYGTRKYGALYKDGTGTWTVGDVDIGIVYLNAGTLIVNGTLTTYYQGIKTFASGARLAGTGTIHPNGLTVPSGAIVAPGDGVGTMTMGQSGKTVQFADNSIYEWEIGDSAGTAVSDTLNITAGTLNLDNFKLKILDAGATVPAGTQLTVFTYTVGSVTIDMAGFNNDVNNFDVTNLDGSWTVGSLLLTNDSVNGVIYLTGLSNSAPGDTNNDGIVDAVDYITVKTHIGQATSAGPAEGDFDNDGDVDWNDLQTLMTGMNAGGNAGGAVPEPATLALLAFGAVAVIRRRRR